MAQLSRLAERNREWNATATGDR